MFRGIVAVALMIGGALLPAPLAAQAHEIPTSAVPGDPALLPPIDASRNARKRAPPFAPRSPVVTVALSSDLGEALPDLRARIEASGFARVGEQTNYRLTNLPDFPQTLVLVSDPAHQEPGDEINRWPRDITLGNLILGDYVPALDAALVKIGRAKALLAAESPPSEARTILCVLHVGAMAQPDCRTKAPPPPGAPERLRVPIDLNVGGGVSFAVRNISPRPQYLYLLGVDADSTITRIPLGDGNATPAGGWAALRAFKPSRRSGFFSYTYVTIASDTPIAEDQLPKPGDAAPTGWSVSTFDYDFVGPHVEGVGGGVSALAGSAPWIAQIYSTVPYTDKELAEDDAKPEAQKKHLRDRTPAGRDHRCGATLIDGDVVITAAHCLASDKMLDSPKPSIFKRRRVRIGTAELGRDGASYAVGGIAVHAGYRIGDEGSPDDIALIRLKPDKGSSPDQMVLTIPVRLASQGLRAGDPVNLFGWGVTGVVAPDGDWHHDATGAVQFLPDELQKGQMQVMAWQACRARLKTALGNRMLCAQSPVDPRTGREIRHVFSCVGDSGGPLVQSDGADAVLVGIVSWSKGCGAPGEPDVYTDVARYADWVAAARKQMTDGQIVFVPQPPAAARR